MNRILKVMAFTAVAILCTGVMNAHAFLYNGLWQPTGDDAEYFSFPLPLFDQGADFYMYMFDPDEGTNDNLLLLDPMAGFAAETSFAQNSQTGSWEVFLENPSTGADPVLDLGDAPSFGLFFDDDDNLSNGFSTLYDVVQLQGTDSYALFPLFSMQDIRELVQLQGEGQPEDFAALVDVTPVTAVPLPGAALLFGAGLVGLFSRRFVTAQA